MVEYGDRLVGRILKALKVSGLAENTVVMYTSDHGEMAGEHGLWWKMSFYEGSAGVPLVFSWPGRFPAGCRAKIPVSLMDVTPTFVELAGADPIPGADGCSLASMLSGSPEKPDHDVFSELFAISWADEGRPGPAGGPARMLRRGDWKYCYYHDQPPELFHLAEDPEERTNRASDLACREILERMRASVLVGWDPEDVTRRAYARKAELLYIADAPIDRKTLEGEYWLCSADCGRLERVIL